jgi:AbrB family looped-hinge helix DNA binding protein
MSESDSNSFDALRKAVEQGNEAQREFMKKLTSVQQDAMNNYISTMQNALHFNAMFKTTVQSGGRISIPEAERIALNIEEGDLVQVIVTPILRKKKGTE